MARKSTGILAGITQDLYYKIKVIDGKSLLFAFFLLYLGHTRTQVLSFGPEVYGCFLPTVVFISDSYVLLLERTFCLRRGKSVVGKNIDQR